MIKCHSEERSDVGIPLTKSVELRLGGFLVALEMTGETVIPTEGVARMERIFSMWRARFDKIHSTRGLHPLASV